MPKPKAKTAPAEKGKRWFLFYSVNGTVQERKQLTEIEAMQFARDEGYQGRYKAE